jgi:hypothetical protein
MKNVSCSTPGCTLNPMLACVTMAARFVDEGSTEGSHSRAPAPTRTS